MKLDKIFTARNCSSRSSFDHASISTESDVDAVGLRAMDVLQRPEGDPSLHDPKTGVSRAIRKKI